jgi:hypothetical protein
LTVPEEPAFVLPHAPATAPGEDESTARFHEKIIALGLRPIALRDGVYDHCLQELF